MSDASPAGGGLLPRLRSDFDRAVLEWRRLYPNRPVPVIVDTVRSNDTQRQAYEDYLNGNRPNNLPVAPPGQSYHEIQSDGFGHAIDVAFVDGAGRTVNDPSLFRSFAGILTTVDPLIAWGGEWRKTDPVHFQFPRANTQTTPTPKVGKMLSESDARVARIRRTIALTVGTILIVIAIREAWG